MTPTEKKQLIQSVIDRYSALASVFDDLGRIAGVCPESPLWDATWKTFELVVDLTEQQIGDDFGFLNWFIQENDCGAKGMEAGINGDMRPMRTVDDLLWLMAVAE